MRRTAMICIVALLLFPVLAQADIPPFMSYQGVLRDAAGNPVPDGTYSVEFNLYDVSTGGTTLWTETQSLYATGGIIEASLGSVTALNTLPFDVPYWLGISVEGEAELVPRTALATVPYAGRAGSAESCDEVDDHDWETIGDNIHRGFGNVGIGQAAPAVRLDVLAGDAGCARFENGSLTSNFTVLALNNSGTAGAFFSGTPPTSYPAVPAAVFGSGGVSSRGGHFTSSGDDALFASSANGKAVWGYSTANFAGYFSGGGMGVYIDDMLETNGFRMQTGSGYGYVLTSDGSGYGTWQPAAGVSDGDWVVAAGDIYSAVPGRVGIGLTLPTAKLEIYNDTSEEALEVKHGTGSVGRVVNIERTAMPIVGQDVLQLKIPAGSPTGCQFIECEVGTAINFSVDGDGYVDSNSGGEFGGAVSVTGSDQRQMEVSTSAVTATTKALSGVTTGLGTGYDPIGVYGESVPGVNYGIGGSFVGGYRGVEGSVIPGAGGDYRGVYGSAFGGSGTNHGVYGSASGGATNYGVFGYAFSGTHYAGYFAGNAHVTGTFTAGVKSFKIDHPLDPENKYLVHSCVESDDMMNIYNGNSTLDARGEVWVEMPDWFEALNQDFRYQLTCIGGFAPVYVAEEVRGGRFMIAGGEPGMKVSWQVTGVRHDPLAVASRMSVEVDKPSSEAGKYMHPEAYGKLRTMGVDYHEEREISSGTASAERTPPPVRERSSED
ncbi:MAG: hypothetical protein ABIE42_11340 [Candidatus Eisenbacteria bacterium]